MLVLNAGEYTSFHGIWIPIVNGGRTGWSALFRFRPALNGTDWSIKKSGPKNTPVQFKNGWVGRQPPPQPE